MTTAFVCHLQRLAELSKKRRGWDLSLDPLNTSHIKAQKIFSKNFIFTNLGEPIIQTIS